MWSRVFRAGTLSFCLQNSTVAVGSKVCLYEPQALISPLAASIGSVRTHRQLKSKKKPKFPEYQLDKRFPFDYTLRVLPTNLTHPGDRDKTLGYIDKSRFKLYYEDSEELKDASEDVKKLFKLNHGTRNDIVDVRRADIFQKIQRHGLDYNSEEMIIAKKTVQIRNCFEKLIEKPHDKVLKDRLNSQVGTRNRLLNELRRKDENRFNWLVKTLEIDHERPLLAVKVYKPHRKLEIEWLTNQYCDKVRNEKIEAHKKVLLAEQLVFQKEKKIAEEWITKKEEEIKAKQQQLNDEDELFWKHKNFRKM